MGVGSDSSPPQAPPRQRGPEQGSQRPWSGMGLRVQRAVHLRPWISPRSEGSGSLEPQGWRQGAPGSSGARAGTDFPAGLCMAPAPCCWPPGSEKGIHLRQGQPLLPSVPHCPLLPGHTTRLHFAPFLVSCRAGSAQEARHSPSLWGAGVCGGVWSYSLAPMKVGAGMLGLLEWLFSAPHEPVGPDRQETHGLEVTEMLTRGSSQGPAGEVTFIPPRRWCPRRKSWPLRVSPHHLPQRACQEPVAQPGSLPLSMLLFLGSAPSLCPCVATPLAVPVGVVSWVSSAWWLKSSLEASLMSEASKPRAFGVRPGAYMRDSQRRTLRSGVD